MARKKTLSKAANDKNRAIELRVIALAEQLGRMVGTVERKTTGWLDMAALSDQVTRIRDGAAELLGHLGTGRGDSARLKTSTAESGSSLLPQATDTAGAASEERSKSRVRKAASPRVAKSRSATPRARNREHVAAPGKVQRKPPTGAAGPAHSDAESTKVDATDRPRRTRGR